MEKLVEVSEPEIRIDFALNSKCRANVVLRSLSAAATVAFKVQTSSPHKFLVNPPTGIIPPLSNVTIQIILKPQIQIPSTFPRSNSDRFLIKTAEFDSELNDSVNSWLSNRPTQDIKLKVAFVGLFLLQKAVESEDFESVRSILKRRKTVLLDLSPEEAEKLLSIATELAEADDMVNLLLEAGLRIDGGGETLNAVDSRWMEGETAGNFDRTVKEARQAKMAGSQPLDLRDRKGRTPFNLAVSEGNIECARELVESDLDKDNRSRRIAEKKMNISVDPTTADNLGRFSLSIARAKRYGEVAGILGGEELLTAARRGDVQRLRLVLRRGANINFSDQYGLNALHVAAIKGNKDVVLMLIDSGLDLESRDNQGHAPLHLAVESGHLDVVEALVDRGATVNCQTKRGVTPLHMAEAMGLTDISQFLVEKGAA